MHIFSFFTQDVSKKTFPKRDFFYKGFKRNITGYNWVDKILINVFNVQGCRKMVFFGFRGKKNTKTCNPFFHTVEQNTRVWTLFHISQPLWKSLTHYHTIPHFESLKIYSCGKHYEKRKKCLKQAISPFLTIFPTLHFIYYPF